ncbi:MAG TPA: MerR family transcriptional regulator [Solirubrobacteraceae bacterium]|nr:MerR family transcriptional regulator [Solirubrobacteraceae bacterium]
MPERLLIGEIARRAGVRISTIRYYESIGVLPEPEREAGRRRYPPETVRTLSLIAAAQRAGLTLADVRQLLGSGAPDRRGASERLRTVARRALPELEARLQETLRARTWLRAAAECHCRTLETCPLFTAPAGAGRRP